MATKYSAKDKFTAREGDFEIIYQPKKAVAPKSATAKQTKKPTTKKK